MSTDALDLEAEDADADEREYPFCDAVPGMAPHNYQPYLDIIKGGTYLWCTQCGDIIVALDPPVTPPGGFQQSSTPSPAAAPAPATTPKPSWP